MTEREAVKVLQHERDYAQLLSYVNEALKIAISAMEKQIPKVIVPDLCYEKDGMYGICSMCGNPNIKFNRYCNKCGQKLEWREE